MKIFPILFVVILAVFLFAENAQAKVLPQATKSLKAASGLDQTSISVSPRVRGDRRALLLNFGNLQNATSVSYILTYKTSTQEEGAMGALTLNGPSNQTSELLFGTCSKNVCRYHTNISQMRLEVSYKSKAGNKYIKRFRIKV